MAKLFRDLSEQEMLALAITCEEDDGRIYGDFAEKVHEEYPSTAASLRRMQGEESGHRRQLFEVYRQRFGDHLPLIRRQDVRGFLNRKPLWLAKTLTVQQVRREVEAMEQEAFRFYNAALKKTTDAGTRVLLGDLAEAESQHIELAENLARDQLASGSLEQEATSERRRFVLQIVQPGLAGLMDGSVSTLAPLFAAAFATHNSWYAFLVGLAASIGAGISMGFAEALSDDGVLSGRGKPWLRGLASGIMTTVGGIGHTLPFLIPDFQLAATISSIIVVLELGAIAWIRQHFMDTPFLSAAFQVILGGLLVFGAGILIGLA